MPETFDATDHVAKVRAIEAAHRLADFCIEEGAEKDEVMEDLNVIRRALDGVGALSQ